jgi:hypothetical protein
LLTARSHDHSTVSKQGKEDVMTDQFDRLFLHARDTWRPRILANAA